MKQTSENPTKLRLTWLAPILAFLSALGFLLLANLGCGEIEINLPDDYDDPLKHYWSFRVDIPSTSDYMSPGSTETFHRNSLVWGYTGRSLAADWSTSYDPNLVQSATVSPTSGKETALQVQVADAEALYGPGAIWTTTNNAVIKVGLTARFVDPVWASLADQEIILTRTAYKILTAPKPSIDAKLTQVRPSYDSQGLLMSFTYKGYILVTGAPPGWQFTFALYDDSDFVVTPQPGGQSATFSGSLSNIFIEDPSKYPYGYGNPIQVNADLKGSQSPPYLWKTLFLSVPPKR